MEAKTGAATIVALGSINMDLVTTMRRMPADGETVQGSAFFTAPGGKGANQAVAAARLGAHVRMVGKVGDDEFGRGLLDGLRSHGIGVQNVAVDARHASGVAMIMVDEAGGNRIAAVYGANMACDGEQVDAAKRAMAGADALMLQLEAPSEVSLAAAKHARREGVRVIWDPAPAAQMPDDAFEYADVLTPNQTEAAMLTGIEITDAHSAREAAQALLAKGVRLAVVKMGVDGVFAAAAAESCHMPAFPVEAVDSVAAGDAFGAALAIALSERRPLKDALRFGAAAGALAVTKRGAQDAMPSREEVEGLLSIRPL